MSYVVRPGDTLSSIAQRLLGSASLWHELTGYSGDPHKLRAGTTLFLPNEHQGPPAQMVKAQRASAAPSTSGNQPAASWDAIPPEYRQQLMQMEHDYETANEFRVPVSDAQLLQMAQNGVNSAYGFAQFMWGSVDFGLQEAMPWAKYGITQDAFSQAVEKYSDTYADLTGQVATKDVLDQALRDSQGRLDVAHFTQKLKADKGVTDTYAWVKYGMNYQEFQQFKSDSRGAFGRDLSDTEAANVLSQQHQFKSTGGATEATLVKTAAGQGPIGEGQAATR